MARFEGIVRNRNGVTVPDATVAVWSPGTTTEITLYTDEDLSVTTPNPTTADSDGRVVFYAEPGKYDIGVLSGGGEPITYSDVHVGGVVSRWAEFENISSPAAPSEGVRMYAKGDELCWIGGDGIEVCIDHTTGSGAASGLEYQPDRYPGDAGIDVAASDEFIGGRKSGWNWQNQQGVVDTDTKEGLELDIPTGASMTTDDCYVLWRPITNPSTTDHTYAMAIDQDGFTNHVFGMALLTGGTEASPTEIILYLPLIGFGGRQTAYRIATDYNTVGAQVNVANLQSNTLSEGGYRGYWVVQHDSAASDELSFFYSQDGRAFHESAITLTPTGGAPTSIGLLAYSRSSITTSISWQAFYHWVRVFESLTLEVGS